MEYCKELYLLRHGETEWNRAGRHQGQRDSRLTRHGREQARAMGAILTREIEARRGFSAFVSPLGRAVETAALALAPLGLDARPDARLAEVGFGAWEGCTDAEIHDGWPESTALRKADPFGWHFTAPDGEGFDALRARISGFLAELEGPAIIVSHGIALRVLRGLCLGLDRAGMAALPGGQGVVWRLRDGTHTVLE